MLALSSASGSAPFDAALRRYVDFLVADGELDVEMEIDPDVTLGPDEEIEVFRIVQEGLANVRKHAGAENAIVSIVQRNGRRVVVVSDDGAGLATRRPRRRPGPEEHAHARRVDRGRALAALVARARERRSRSCCGRCVSGQIGRNRARPFVISLT